MTDPNKDIEQRALEKLNAEKSWIAANRQWLVAIAVALVIGFILAKLV